MTGQAGHTMLCIVTCPYTMAMSYTRPMANSSDPNKAGMAPDQAFSRAMRAVHIILNIVKI